MSQPIIYLLHGRFYGYVVPVENGWDAYLGWANGPMAETHYVRVVAGAESEEEAMELLQDGADFHGGASPTGI